MSANVTHTFALLALPMVGTIVVSLAGLAHAGYFPNTPMPDRPGCVYTRCDPIFDGYRYGQRCRWRCPRLAPRRYRPEPPRYAAPPPPPAKPTPPAPAVPTPAPIPAPPPPVERYDDTPRYRAPLEREPAAHGDDDSMLPWAILGLIAFAVLAAISRHFDSLAAARSTDDDFELAAKAATVRQRLDAAARDADEVLARYRASMRNAKENGERS